MIPDVLKNGFLMAEILAGLPVEFPEDSVFSYREDHVLATVIDQHALENDIQIERLARRVRERPGKLPGFGIQRERRVSI